MDAVAYERFLRWAWTPAAKWFTLIPRMASPDLCHCKEYLPQWQQVGSVIVVLGRWHVILGRWRVKMWTLTVQHSRWLGTPGLLVTAILQSITGSNNHLWVHQTGNLWRADRVSEPHYNTDSDAACRCIHGCMSRSSDGHTMSHASALVDPYILDTLGDRPVPLSVNTSKHTISRRKKKSKFTRNFTR